MATVSYVRNEVNTILNSDMTAREMLHELLGLPSDVFNADRPYCLDAVVRVEKMIDIVEGRV